MMVHAASDLAYVVRDWLDELLPGTDHLQDFFPEVGVVVRSKSLAARLKLPHREVVTSMLHVTRPKNSVFVNRERSCAKKGHAHVA